MNKIIFITGGARSGKSTFGENLALELLHKLNNNSQIAYIATAEKTDTEFEERIKKHQKRRGKEFITYEEQLNLSGQIKSVFDKYNIFIIECLTTWLGNIYYHSQKDLNKKISSELSSLSSIIKNEIESENDKSTSVTKQLQFLEKKSSIDNLLSSNINDKIFIIISNEIGMGLVPENEMSRSFRDDLGFINKQIAEISDYVFLCVSGIPKRIK